MKTKHILYKGEVELTFEPFQHKYVVNGKVVPSVTNILQIIAKPALINWAAKMSVEYMEGAIEPGKSYDELQLGAIFKNAKKAHWQKKVDAGDLGTFVHNWVEKYINGENPPIPVNEVLRESIFKFFTWVKKHDVKFLVAEQVVYSRKYNYVGTLDFICVIDGEMYIGDLKTSKRVYSGYYLQTAAYRYAREEECPEEKYAGQLILRIGKDGSLEAITIKERYIYEETLLAFLSAQKLGAVVDELKSYKPQRG